jgi:hypothetical protein
MRLHLGNHLPIADQTVSDFGVVDLVPKLSFMRWRFGTPDDLHGRLPPAGHFFLPGMVSTELAAVARLPQASARRAKALSLIIKGNLTFILLSLN